MALDVKKIRKDFPILQRKINGHRFVYLDNTATTQKPLQVIDAISAYYRNTNANVHRGAYELSLESSELYEKAHEKTAKFIGANSWKEIVFTRNTTESLNVLAHSLSKMLLKKGDRVLITKLEHHSNIVPWQQLKEKGVKLEWVDVTREGRLDEKDLEEKLSHKPKIFSFTGASNALGTLNDVKRLSRMGKDAGATTILDAAQLVPHRKLDVKKTGADFCAFSGHKMLGPTGIGVLSGKEELLESMPPFLTGGDMIKTVSFEKSTWNSLPWKFEAGTPNISGGIGLAAAIDYLEKIGFDGIERHEKKLLEKATSEIERIPCVEIYGPEPRHKLGIISFNVKGVHPHDVSTVLDEKGIAIRSGNHCAQPLMDEMGIVGTARASFYVYNDLDDVQALVDGIREVKRVFKISERREK